MVSIKLPDSLGPWKIGDILGEGAFSIVTTASLNKLPDNKDVANELGANQWVLKVSQANLTVKKKKRAQASGATLLFQEYTLYRLLKDRYGDIPCIPKTPNKPFYKYQSTGGFCFLAMQRLGITLRDAIKENATVDTSTSFCVGLKILDGLEKLHQMGFVYRDIKPENFMLGGGSTRGNKNQVFIIDFGAVFKYMLASGKKNELGTPPAGTPFYMSRNIHQSRSPTPIDDIESLGYMLLLMLSGKLPWANATSEQKMYEEKNAVWNRRGCLVKDISDAVARDSLQKYFDYIDRFGKDDFIDFAELRRIFIQGSGIKTMEKLLMIELKWPNMVFVDESAKRIKEPVVSKSKKVKLHDENMRDAIKSEATIDNVSKVRKVGVRLNMDKMSVEKEQETKKASLRRSLRLKNGL